ncbi:MAG: tRNA (guanosine(37)-N1)-methyltransferase TrmD [Proteobacteria bacterium]|nr:tRNA (guanosine(37)-N1)-methyltransferase TrmD [Pseudomonadota bacterium]
MIFDILTIFPDLFDSPLKEGILRRARLKGQISTNIVNIRDFADDPQTMTDDRPFGGGEGMVMKPEPLARAVKSRCEAGLPGARVILLTPQGRQYDQAVALELTKERQLVLVCGRYEGVDERFRAGYIDDEISIGDFILTGGELAALVIIDSVTRLLPGVLGCSNSAEKDTFSRKLLKHPQYTRPRVFDDQAVPDELLSGNHEMIEAYRFIASVLRTLERRPELLKLENFSTMEIKLLRRHYLFEKVRMIQENTQEK